MKTLKSYFNKDYFDLLLVMTKKEIKARYKGTVAGFLWLVLNPFLQMIIIGFVFSYFVKVENYFLFLFMGLLPWQFFSTALTQATSCFVFERFLLQKSKFAKEIIPLSIVLSGFMNLLISMSLLTAFLLVTGQIDLFKILVILGCLIWLLVITSSISLLTSSLNVRYRDVSFFMQSLLILWFYATPIIYRLDQVSEKIRFVVSLNPLVSIFELLHLTISTGSGSVSPTLILQNAALTLFILTASIFTYKKLSTDFVDWL